MSLNAYARTQQSSESPSETEYRLFARVTGSLIEAQEKDLRGAALMKALDWNRRLWSTLATDCASDGNRLPEETRAGIISLALYVRKITRPVFRGELPIEDLIVINKRIMAGLEEQNRRRRAGEFNTAAPRPISADGARV
ncbi:MAG: flagellar biosynthesis regulator FlaF [Rhodothalassiaceae bacterium]